MQPKTDRQTDTRRWSAAPPMGDYTDNVSTLVAELGVEVEEANLMLRVIAVQWGVVGRVRTDGPPSGASVRTLELPRGRRVTVLLARRPEEGHGGAGGRRTRLDLWLVSSVPVAVPGPLRRTPVAVGLNGLPEARVPSRCVYAVGDFVELTRDAGVGCNRASKGSVMVVMAVEHRRDGPSLLTVVRNDESQVKGGGVPATVSTDWVTRHRRPKLAEDKEREERRNRECGRMRRGRLVRDENGEVVRRPEADTNLPEPDEKSLTDDEDAGGD